MDMIDFTNGKNNVTAGVNNNNDGPKDGVVTIIQLPVV